MEPDMPYYATARQFTPWIKGFTMLIASNHRYVTLALLAPTFCLEIVVGLLYSDPNTSASNGIGMRFLARHT